MCVFWNKLSLRSGEFTGILNVTERKWWKGKEAFGYMSVCDNICVASFAFQPWALFVLLMWILVNCVSHVFVCAPENIRVNDLQLCSQSSLPSVSAGMWPHLVKYRWIIQLASRPRPPLKLYLTSCWLHSSVLMILFFLLFVCLFVSEHVPLCHCRGQQLFSGFVSQCLC